MKRHAPATLRNREPILEVLRHRVRGDVLEIASGTGEHAAFFAAQLPGVTWQPSDVGDAELASIAAHREDAGAPNLLAPVCLDVRGDWPAGPYDAVFCANMIHIAPPECTPALISGAARVLRPGGVLVLYGPFRVGGAHTAESNERFEEWLLSLDPRFGVRDLDGLVEMASGVGLEHAASVAMPANNFCVVWGRS